MPTEVNGARTTASQTSPRRCDRGHICREAFVNVFAHNNAGARLEPRLCGMRDEGVTARTASGETQKGYEKGGGQQS